MIYSLMRPGIQPSRVYAQYVHHFLQILISRLTRTSLAHGKMGI